MLHSKGTLLKPLLRYKCISKNKMPARRKASRVQGHYIFLHNMYLNFQVRWWYPVAVSRTLPIYRNTTVRWFLMMNINIESWTLTLHHMKCLVPKSYSTRSQTPRNSTGHMYSSCLRSTGGLTYTYGILKQNLTNESLRKAYNHTVIYLNKTYTFKVNITITTQKKSQTCCIRWPKVLLKTDEPCELDNTTTTENVKF